MQQVHELTYIPPWGRRRLNPLCFLAIREHSPNSWWIDGMEGGEGGGGLRFLLQFDPARPGLDRTLLGFSFSALFSRLAVGWSKGGQTGGGVGGGSTAIAAEGEGGEGSGNAAVSAAALAAAASLCLAAMYASDQRRPRRARARRLPAPASAPRSRALPAPHDGLRILSSDDPNDESPDNVIHGASIGAGDDEPDIVARVEMPAAVPVPNAGDETVTETEPVPDHPEEEEEEEERQELQRLRELWLSLLEREQRLELRLQELEGLRSQEATARELESRVAAADEEVRLLRLRVSALQEDNGRLRARAEDLDAARADLARAKEKLRAVKARVRGEQEAAAALRRRVEELESGGEERAAALAAEVAELRKANAALEEDNMELALRLQDAEEQAASAAANLAPEEGMVQEMTYLRESNERLTREIEQLRNDHCAHVEELVYLKWVNACLRHELRDHDGQPTAEQQGHSAGSRDLSSALELSKSMSFRSSEKAKQLMLRYGSPGLDRFDPALFSPLHESVDGNGDGYGYERSPAHSYDPERSPCARPGTAMAAAASPAAAPGKKAGPRRLKLLGNIKKLLPAVGKRSHSNHGHGHAGHDGRKAPAPAPRDEYLEKAMRWLSAHDVLDGDHSYVSTPLSSCERTPLSSATTSTTADSRARGGDGGGGRSERGEATRPEAEPTLARSKSDAGGAYGREASRYHALRPERPASEAVEPDGFRAPGKREARRQSAEVLRTPAVA